MSTEKTEITVDTAALPQGDQPATTTESTETLFAGEFKSVDDLAAAYAALKAEKAKPESEGNDGSEGSGEERPESLEIPKDNPSDDKTAQEAVEGAGLDWTALNAEYAEKGSLSQETYERLAKGGIPKDAVDTYIAGKQAQADAYDAAVFGTAGGVENYNSLINWAKGELPMADKVAFNDAVTSNDPARARMAVEALMTRYESKNGKRPETLLNGKKTAAGVQPFASRAEMTEAMRSPRYKTDSAFRAEVVERLRLSDF